MSSSTLEDTDTAPAASLTVGGFSLRQEAVFHDGYGPAFIGTRPSDDSARPSGVCLRRFSRPTGISDGHWKRIVDDFEALFERFRALNGTPGFQEILGTIALGDQLWAAYAPLNGVSLRTYLRSVGGQAPPEWATELLRQIGKTLNALSQHDLIHGDLTLDTIYVQPNGKSAQLSFFGLALLRDKFGSPYAPPEQWDGYEGDRRADVFAMGAVLHEVIFGSPAFPGISEISIAALMQNAPPAHLPKCSDATRDVLLTMLARYPTRRYVQVLHAAEDLGLQRTPPGIESVRLLPDPEKTPFESLTADENRITSLALNEKGEVCLRRDYLQKVQHPLFKSAAAQGMNPVPEPKVEIAPKKTISAATLYQDATHYIVETRATVAYLIHLIREERRRRLEEDRLEPIRERRRKALVCGLFLVAILTPIGGVAVFRSAYCSATITATLGSVGNDFDADHHTYIAGDRLEASDPGRSEIHTGPKASVLLTLHDACLKIAADTHFSIVEMEYPIHSAPVRHFALRQGSVLFAVNPQYPGAIFDVECRGVHVMVHGTAFRVATKGAHDVLIQTAEGTVRVIPGGEAETEGIDVRAGRQLTIASMRRNETHDEADTPEPTLFDGAYRSALVRLEGFRPRSQGPAAAIEDWEASHTVPLLQLTAKLLDWDGIVNQFYHDPMRIASAKNALLLVGKLIEANSEIGGPTSATDLKELSLTEDERSTCLRFFKDGHLQYYHRLPNNGCEIAARATDSKGTLIILRNGSLITKKEP